MRAQSIPLKIALVECSPLHPQFSLPPQIRDMADIVFSVSENIGPCSRFIPPLALLAEHKYTFFAVDDHVPGPRHVESLVRCAQIIGDDRFTTIGQDGRAVRGGEVVKRKIHQEVGRAIPCDVITTSELVLTENVVHAVTFRKLLHHYHYGSAEPFGGRDGGDFEDDLLLCFGIQFALQEAGITAPSYVAPLANDDSQAVDESWRSVRLHAPDALCARPGHKEIRDRFVRQAQDVGWKSPSEEMERGQSSACQIPS